MCLSLLSISPVCIHSYSLFQIWTESVVCRANTECQKTEVPTMTKRTGKTHSILQFFSHSSDWLTIDTSAQFCCLCFVLPLFWNTLLGYFFLHWSEATPALTLRLSVSHVHLISCSDNTRQTRNHSRTPKLRMTQSAANTAAVTFCFPFFAHQVNSC